MPNAVLGTIVIVGAEVMFFAALISAHTIARASAMGGMWPPPGQPRLPVARTAINTAALLTSGVMLWLANRYLARAPKIAQRVCVEGDHSAGSSLLCRSGNGVEWNALIREGLTLTSSSHGSFFYLIVGAHALHAVVAIAALAWVYLRLRAGRLRPEVFAATQVFWYFVVAALAHHLFAGVSVRHGTRETTRNPLWPCSLRPQPPARSRVPPWRMPAPRA